MHVKVRKFDPAAGEEPWYAEGDVEYREHMSALELIKEFSEQVEPVSFDMSCSGATCGRCAMTVNGEPVLACITPVEDGQDYTFEPLAGYPIIRDLVVERGELRDHIAEAQRRTQLEPIDDSGLVPPNYSADDNALAFTLERCTRCGICNSVCPVYNESPDEYVGPAVMLATAYRCLDGYDNADRLSEAVSRGLYRCIMCGKCQDACPKVEIEHLTVWKTMRERAEAAGLKPSYAD